MQLAGNKPSVLVPAAEIIAKECAGGLDFVDLNCGCPIDLVYKTGSGSARKSRNTVRRKYPPDSRFDMTVLDTAGKLGRILVGMNKALGEVPLTVKLRTGVKEGKNTAHKLMPRLGSEWGASMVTVCSSAFVTPWAFGNLIDEILKIHGRTRQQRYTKLADWDYIKQCVEAVRAQEAEEDCVFLSPFFDTFPSLLTPWPLVVSPIPIFGGGDVFSSEEYWEKMDKSGVDGIMIARGALIKPWIFTEVKERREWDISSRERLDLVRKVSPAWLSQTRSLVLIHVRSTQNTD